MRITNVSNTNIDVKGVYVCKYVSKLSFLIGRETNFLSISHPDCVDSCFLLLMSCSLLFFCLLHKIWWLLSEFSKKKKYQDFCVCECVRVSLKREVLSDREFDSIVQLFDSISYQSILMNTNGHICPFSPPLNEVSYHILFFRNLCNFLHTYKFSVANFYFIWLDCEHKSYESQFAVDLIRHIYCHALQSLCELFTCVDVEPLSEISSNRITLYDHWPHKAMKILPTLLFC